MKRGFIWYSLRVSFVILLAIWIFNFLIRLIFPVLYLNGVKLALVLLLLFIFLLFIFIISIINIVKYKEKAGKILAITSLILSLLSFLFLDFFFRIKG